MEADYQHDKQPDIDGAQVLWVFTVGLEVGEGFHYNKISAKLEKKPNFAA
jgi:hypothetical protein